MSSSTSTARAEVQTPVSGPRITPAHQNEVTENARATAQNAKETAKSSARTGRGVWHSTQDLFTGVAGTAKYAAYDLPKAGLTKAAGATSNGLKSSAAAASQGVKNFTQPATAKGVLGAMTGAALLLGGAYASVVLDLTLELLLGVMLHQLMLVGALACLAYVVTQLVKRAIAALANRSAEAAEATAQVANQAKASASSAVNSAAEASAQAGNEADAEPTAEELAPSKERRAAYAEAKHAEILAKKAEIEELNEQYGMFLLAVDHDNVGELRQQLADKNAAISDLQAKLTAAEADKETAINSERDAAQAKVDAVTAEKAEVQAERDAVKAKVDAAESSALKAQAEAEANKVDLTEAKKEMAELRSGIKSLDVKASAVEGEIAEADQKQGEARASASVQAA